mmetsp:Transcript_60270/g.161738  ORF Transcript_60270/g.161738 Transcript_60270/m.161738 type:complete len:218 (+) Transcript_60270:90-743(+)
MTPPAPRHLLDLGDFPRTTCSPGSALMLWRGVDPRTSTGPRTTAGTVANLLATALHHHNAPVPGVHPSSALLPPRVLLPSLAAASPKRNLPVVAAWPAAGVLPPQPQLPGSAAAFHHQRVRIHPRDMDHNAAAQGGQPDRTRGGVHGGRVVPGGDLRRAGAGSQGRDVAPASLDPRAAVHRGLQCQDCGALTEEDLAGTPGHRQLELLLHFEQGRRR